MKRALMVAYHFPPYALSSGIQRTLRFVQHLPDFGWQPIVLTVSPRAYERTSQDLMPEVPKGVIVERAFAIDAARHLSIAGRYPGLLARPDRWISWQYAGVPAGLRLIRKWKPEVIWSTYPIATAHVIGNSLARRTGLPWIADFRDPMAQDGYPPEPKTWRSFRRIEEQAIRRARFSTFTAPNAARLYRDRYRDVAQRIVLLENGFDEESFAGLGSEEGGRRPLNPGVVTLLHSGVVYPSERDPTQLFAALKKLADSGALTPDRLKIRFRAALHDDFLRDLAARLGVEGFIELMPSLPYGEALSEMTHADGLMLLQAANCNEQIPAKLYEYLRCGRPILALTDKRGDTAAVLREAGVDTIAALDSAEEIVDALQVFVEAVSNTAAPLPNTDYVNSASRKRRTEALAHLFDAAAAPVLLNRLTKAGCSASTY